MHKLQWFYDRIGQRVYRDLGTCSCGICQDSEKHGIIIADEFQAECLHMYQIVHKYRDTK